ncbi:MAG: TRAP transporter fused permease subunit [Candidatus Atribacteria bacterium]|nr:TRAP transporter fused permease subunit [Candidatus Atribacteria bacterium]
MNIIKKEEKIDSIKENARVIFRGDFRTPTKIYLLATSLALFLFEMYIAYFGILDPLKQVSFYATFILSIGFILFPFSKERRPKGKCLTFDNALTIIGICLPLYIIIFHDSILLRYGYITLLETIMAYVLVFIFMELGRRTFGPILPIITVFFLLYAIFGKVIPGPIRHSGINIKYLASSLYTTTQGIWGLPMIVTSKYIYLFIFLGTLSVVSGCGELIIKSAKSLAGKSSGGPAKIAVIASGFFGSISGSSVANIVTTGSFTIPMMKKLGFSPHFAGAVEAVASTGGVIMPPVMGAVAFIMAELMNVSYFDVVKAALIPAILYFFSVFWIIHLRANKLGIKGLESSGVPKFFITLKSEGYLFLPMLVLIYFLLFKRMSPQISAFWAIITMLIIYILKNLKEEKSIIINNLLNCILKSAKIAVSLSAAVAMAGIIMNVVLITGLSLRISNIIISFANENTILILGLTMITSLILGMGVTASVAYIVPSILVVPVLVKSGILPMAANLFVFYFAVISYITPPVAISSYAAAGIANADMFKTSYEAVKIGLIGFIIPFMFIYNPSLIMVGSPFKILTSIVSACIGVILLGISMEGFALMKVGIIGRVLSFIGAILLIGGEYTTDIFGIIILLLIYVTQKYKIYKYKEKDWSILR